MRTIARLRPFLLSSVLLVAACAPSSGTGTASSAPAAAGAAAAPGGRVERSEEEWRALLTEQQFYVTRQGGTERAFTGEYWDTQRHGTFTCVCCDQPLFHSEHKFDSGTGWPSFWQPIADGRVAEHADQSLGMVRTELLCSRCDAHLGHVFPDGPRPTGLRYCINSAALRLVEE